MCRQIAFFVQNAVSARFSAFFCPFCGISRRERGPENAKAESACRVSAPVVSASAVFLCQGCSVNCENNAQPPALSQDPFSRGLKMIIFSFLAEVNIDPKNRKLKKSAYSFSEKYLQKNGLGKRGKIARKTPHFVKKKSKRPSAPSAGRVVFCTLPHGLCSFSRSICHFFSKFAHGKISKVNAKFSKVVDFFFAADAFFAKTRRKPLCHSLLVKTLKTRVFSAKSSFVENASKMKGVKSAILGKLKKT